MCNDPLTAKKQQQQNQAARDFFARCYDKDKKDSLPNCEQANETTTNHYGFVVGDYED